VSTDNRTPAQVKAAEAGAKGKSAAPMSMERRLANYKRQNHSHWCTPRQERQLRRMLDREMRRDGAR
jgi:hypothetical protein